MNKIIIASVFALMSNLTIYAQKSNLGNVDYMEIVLNEKAEGFGPRGNFSSGITRKDSMDSLELAACPKMKNIPDNLSNLVEYCDHSNRFQFFYQNYRNGVFPKDYFLKVTSKQKWNLKDTIQLTEKNLKTIISIATGVNSDGIRMYIVDSQNNGDFSDDVMKPLLPSSDKQEEVVRNSCSVAIEYFDGKSVKTDNQLMIVQSFPTRKTDEPSFLLGFPQFRYSKFTYKNKSYIVCKEFNDYHNSIFILNDRPNFSRINDKEVKPLQFVELDGDYFQYIPRSGNSDRILLKKVVHQKEDSINQNAKNTIASANQKSLPVASQIAMIAPEISGLNILNDLNISLNSIKGKYVFIDFWSTTCAPCIAEFPNIKEVYQKYGQNQLEIIGIVDDRTSDGKIKEFIQKKGLTWPNIKMNIKSTNIQNYDIRGYPTTYLINPNGVIIATNLRGNELLNKLQSLKVKE